MLDTDVLGRPGSLGSDGLKWWIGRVAPRSSWAPYATLVNDKDVGLTDADSETDVYYNRVKVSVVGYHEHITNPYDLPWAHIMATPMLPTGYGFQEHTHYLEGGESVFGFWMDGDDEQKPVVLGVFYRHKMADDQRTPVKGSPSVSSSQGKGCTTKKETQEGVDSGAKKVSTGKYVPKETYKSGKRVYDRSTGTIKGTCPERYPVSDEGGSKGVSGAVLEHHFNLKRNTSRPSCKRDNTIAQITGYLGDFAELLIGIEQYADFYVDEITGVVRDIQGDLKAISKKIAKVITGNINQVRDTIFAFIGDKISGFLNSLLPEELKPILGQGIKGAMDVIYCLFENVIASIFNVVFDLLGGLVGQFINAPLCAAEEFVGALLGTVNGFIDDTISPILDTLSGTLGGILGSISNFVSKALNVVGLIYSFIGCDEFKCPLPSRYDTAYGPQQGLRNKVDNITSKFDIVPDMKYDKDGNAIGTGNKFYDNIDKNFGNIFNLKELTPEQQQNAEDIAAVVGGCQTGLLRCGPPQIEIFGGDGIGGAANAVVSEFGQIIGADLVDKGSGYTVPPYVRFKDACGNGKGGRGRVVINDDGQIDRIIIDYQGYGYYNDFREIKTIYGDILQDVTIPPPTSDGETVIGEIEDISVDHSGSSYDEDTTVVAVPDNGSILEPIIVNGHIMGVNIVDPGKGFTTIPDIEINSSTGNDADLTASLKFRSVTEADAIDPDKVLFVVNCVGR
tara:strand:+ start:1735 stop:3933 length:2199 start_codon:yes stop_codon:yes gene_type:complete